jgi:predicted nucleic acid-binding protein
LTVYLDTSVLVAALTEEVKTADVQAWLPRAADLLISDWVVTEFSSALALKLRTGHITPAQRAIAISLFNRSASESWRVLSVVQSHFQAAARFAAQHTLGLRAGDALHMAICADAGATLCTLDQRMAEAGPVLGVPILAL